MKRNALFGVPLILALSVLAGVGCSKDESSPASPTPVTESFESGVFTGGNSFVHTFNTAGSFSYRCRIHTPTMTGVVDVAASGADSVLIVITGNAFPAPTVGSFPIKTGGYVRWRNDGANHTVSRP